MKNKFFVYLRPNEVVFFHHLYKYSTGYVLSLYALYHIKVLV